MWLFSKIEKLEEEKRLLKTEIEAYQEVISLQKEDKRILAKEYERILSQEFTFRDVEEVFRTRLNFLDAKIEEFENHNVPELATQVFIRKQELTDTLAAIEVIFKNKEDIKNKNFEERLEREYQKTSVI